MSTPAQTGIAPSIAALTEVDTETGPELERFSTHIEPARSRESVDFIFETDDHEAIERYRSHTDPAHPETNAQDPWQYHFDVDTGKRIVFFVDQDRGDPRNWSKGKKWTITMALGLLCFLVAFASAVVTGDIEGPMEYFHVSQEVIILTVTLFVVGFGVGPLVFAPASEEFGRRIVYAVTIGVAIIFIIPCAVAKNIGTLLVCRLIDGIAFSAPMTLIGGSLADMWVNEERGIAMSIFSAAPFLGPSVGPLVGGFIGDNADWRWIYYTTLIFAGVVYVVVLLIPETHHNTILHSRAAHLRKLTGDETYCTARELNPIKFGDMARTSLLRPGKLLKEIIVFLVTIYMSVIYGLLYMFFFAYPVVFSEGKQWPAWKTGLMFIPVVVGCLISTAVSPFVNQDYVKRAKRYTDMGEVPPAELRLLPMMYGCWFVPVGLFIFAWTSYPNMSWVGPAMGGLPAGVGFILLYNSANNYIVDSYQNYAASALAAKTFVRSIWGACVPLFTIQMYHRLGYQWAGSLLAFISLACCLIPFLFYVFGAQIRAKSKYAFSPVEKLATEGH